MVKCASTKVMLGASICSYSLCKEVDQDAVWSCIVIAHQTNDLTASTWIRTDLLSHSSTLLSVRSPTEVSLSHARIVLRATD